MPKLQKHFFRTSNILKHVLEGSLVPRFPPSTNTGLRFLEAAGCLPETNLKFLEAAGCLPETNLRFLEAAGCLPETNLRFLGAAGWLPETNLVHAEASKKKMNF